MLAGSVLLAGWLLLSGNTRLTTLGPGQWGWMLLTGALLAAYVATWFAALARAHAVDVTAVLVVAVPITALLTALAQHASLRPQLGGLLLIAAGAGLLTIRMARRPELAAA